jgi:hypothetical protein
MSENKTPQPPAAAKAAIEMARVVLASGMIEQATEAIGHAVAMGAVSRAFAAQVAQASRLIHQSRNTAVHGLAKGVGEAVREPMREFSRLISGLVSQLDALDYAALDIARQLKAINESAIGGEYFDRDGFLEFCETLREQRRSQWVRYEIEGAYGVDQRSLFRQLSSRQLRAAWADAVDDFYEFGAEPKCFYSVIWHFEVCLRYQVQRRFRISRRLRDGRLGVGVRGTSEWVRARVLVSGMSPPVGRDWACPIAIRPIQLGDIQSETYSRSKAAGDSRHETVS